MCQHLAGTVSNGVFEKGMDRLVGLMKKTVILLVICCMVILPVLTGCASSRTVSEYVCIREYDGDHGLNDEMMDAFMSRYCKENGLKYVPWFDVEKPEESGYVRLCVFSSEDRSVFGMGYEYPDEEAAIDDFRSGAQLFSASQEGAVDVMSAFSVRVGKYIFWRSGECWASLLTQVGIYIQPNIYQVPVKEEIPYLKMERAYTADELLDLFRSKDYCIYCYTTEMYNVISPDGSETFSIWIGEMLQLVEKYKDDLYHGIFDPWPEDAAIGLTVYRCGDCVVIGRGNTFLSVVGE